ncbi:protein SAWADEE HOMEODOMAIN HOMOLOG 1-like isoform X2 [Tasmannia lanceolata]|uniref:protein SAWADEE HOMEODOMAIN HOMOLOG 1-like isoform X2 n=1 Tax=Tasmannia lanceolata TaxID=3420 RepID=UPI004063E05F
MRTSLLSEMLNGVYGKIEQMEKLFEKAEDPYLNQNFCEKVTKKFNLASDRAAKTAVQWKQVQNWFQCKQQVSTVKVSPPIVSKEIVVLPDASPSNSAPESSSDIPEGVKAPDLSELEFEARSSKDGAWYDVATFLTHRVLSSGEQEVRVRFVGFGAEEDEWVNIKRAVRERSLPLEPSECRKVDAGDPVLCYRERMDDATYFDAHVLEVRRRLHDIRGCRCLFLIRYDHDHLEERVNLRRICRRPSY